ncbi:MAG: universal stress protein [Bdellovibrionales bacterium]|nr:universal stress protein [Bdellovibrionales bacterium]
MKALWAFEPFHQDKIRLRGLHSTLKQLVGSSSNIEVGFVVTRTESFLNLAFDVPAEERFSLYPRKLIKMALRKAGLKFEDKKIHVVEHRTLSTTETVDRLLKLAKARGTDILGLFTHARKGYMRFAVGSIAETAIHRSKMSLLLLNPKAHTSPKIKKVLFASDFGTNSKTQLKKVIGHCKKMKASLILLHHAEATYEWSLDESNPKIHAYRRKVNRLKLAMEQECRKAKVPTNIIVSSELRATADLIFKCAKREKADLIVVAAKTGPQQR